MIDVVLFCHVHDFSRRSREANEASGILFDAAAHHELRVPRRINGDEEQCYVIRLRRRLFERGSDLGERQRIVRMP
jgi:hypothetical protein